MFGRTSFLNATALALPFSLAAAVVQAGDIAETVQQNQQLSTFAKAMETAKFDQQLSGEGPYTVFAPTDRAFEQLPPSALDELMKQENQAQLTKLLGHHVLQGQAMAADDVLGQQTQIDTMSGDILTVDGTSQVVLLVPTGLTITRVGDQVVVERGGGQEQQTAAQTPTAEGSDMPMTEHQQEALKSEPGQEQQQTAPEGTAMPATEHQRQVLAGGEQPDMQQQTQGQQQAQGQQQQEMAAQTPTAEQSDMPMTEHQQEALKTEPAKEQQQTAPEGTAMPATEHQREVLAEKELPGVKGKSDLLREATVVEPGIQADNGVIHIIDAVLVPQEVLKMLEGAKQGQG
jgi:uncharacterized surface protein with fasciclin (FAS1) repeats